MIFVEITFRKEDEGPPWFQCCVSACGGRTLSYTQTLSTPIIVLSLFLSLLPASDQRYARTLCLALSALMTSSALESSSEEYYLLDCTPSVSLFSCTYTANVAFTRLQLGSFAARVSTSSFQAPCASRSSRQEPLLETQPFPKIALYFHLNYVNPLNASSGKTKCTSLE